MQIRRLTCLLVATGVGALGATSTANAAGRLTGAGSTLVAPLMSQWGSDYQGRSGNQIVYGAVGSGAGIKNITANAVDFGASDAPLSPAQAAACPSCFQIPWALSATALGFHINGQRKLRLTPDIIAKIYLGQIKNWSDPAIQRANKGYTSVPNLQITPIFRSDGSGDTYAFTDFLSRVNGTWARSVGYGTTVNFPAGNGAKGNSGVTASVQSTNGAIGYISASYLISAGVPAAAVKNNAGRFAKPNLGNIEAAAKTVHSVPSNNELHIVNPGRGAKNAYPISTFTYVITRHDGAQKALLKDFINYVLGPGQSFGPALDFAPLPSVVFAAAKRSVGLV